MQVNLSKGKIFIIAETACSHEGSAKRLKYLVKSAHDAGADAIQFQVWNFNDMVTPIHPNYQNLKSLQLSSREWKNIFTYTKKNFPSLEIIACIYDLNALKLCEKLGANSYKIHSSDLGNVELLKKVSKTRKRIDLSIGGSQLSEIKKSLRILKYNNVWLMYGYQLFPTNPKNLNLLQLKKYEKIFNRLIGYQDHSPPDLSGFTVPAAALGVGIKIIEKHLTDNRERKGTDAEAALNPKEFKLFVQKCREAAMAIGDGKIKKLTKDQEKYRVYAKKKIFLSKGLKKNSIIKRKDLLIRQPIGKIGIDVDFIGKIIGKSIKKDMKAFSIVEKKHLK
jgi:N,N'-diacetyllegionaminate synthase